jgi:DNA-binding phage protein
MQIFLNLIKIAIYVALRTVAEANGGIPELAPKIRLNRQHLYRSLSNRGKSQAYYPGNNITCPGFQVFYCSS